MNISFSRVIYHACLLSMYQYTKFEVPSFNDSKDLIEAKLKTGHVALTTPTRG